MTFFDKEISAIIVARAGSKRVKGKNLSPLGGVSLLARKIEQLKSSKLIDRIIVGSESLEILEEAERYGAEPIKRPDFFCDEALATANDMIGNMCALIETDVVLWAHCTNPLVDGPEYDKAIISFFEANELGYDSLLSVYAIQEHLWSSEKKPLNYNPYSGSHPPASTLSKIYGQDGAIFIQPHGQMLENSYFFGQNPYLYEMPQDKVLDIDTEVDFSIARALVERA